MLGLGQPAGGLDPAETLLDALVQPLDRGVTRMAGGAPVRSGSCAACRSCSDGCRRRCGGEGDDAVAHPLDELGHVLGLVGAEGDPPPCPATLQHGQRGIDDQRVGVLHKQMAHETQSARLAVALAVEPGIAIGS